MATAKLSVVLLLVLACISLAQDVQDSDVWGDNNVNQFGIAQPNVEDVPLDVDLSSKIKYRYKSIEKQKAFILDGVLNVSTLANVKAYTMVELGAWKFSLYEPYEGGKELPSDNIPWINSLDCVEFGNSMAGRLLQKAVLDASGSRELYYPYQVRAKIMRRGDYTRLHTDASKEDDEYSLIMFLNEQWDKNGYGEVYLYDEEREIFAGATPHYGRVIMWQSHLPYLPRPPSIALQQGEVLLHVQFTKSKDKVLKSHNDWLDARSKRIAITNGDFVGTGKPAPPSIDFDSKMVASYQSLKGKKIYVFDDLYSKEDLDQLRSFVLNYGTYYFDDSEDGGDSDNVQWIAGFNIEKYIESRIWNITRRVARHVSGSDQWFPYDISCNLIRNADHTRIHHDCGEHEDEWTHLIYLNPDMTRNDYGETAFYEHNSDNTEIIAEVRPKYGRTVIFQGIIPHSARPPSTNYSRARLSFVNKMSVNEVVGRTKAFAEELRHFGGVQEQLKFVKLLETHGASVVRPTRTKSSKYPSSNGDEASEDGEEVEEPEDEGPEEEEPKEGTEPNNNGAPTEEPPPGLKVPDPEEGDDVDDDPEINMLQQKLNEASTVDDVRAVHRELMARHSTNREIVRTSLGKAL